MDIDGKNKTRVLEQAANGAWSGDGKTIVYCSGKDSETVSLLDVSSGKVIKLEDVTFGAGFVSCATADITWSKDQKTILFDTAALNLETLEIKGAQPLNPTAIPLLGWGDREEQQEFERYEQTFVVTFHPKVYFQFGDAQGASGLWVWNRDGSFVRLLRSCERSAFGSSSQCGDPIVSPDFSILCFDNGAIYCGDLGVTKESPERVFRTDMTAKAIVAKCKEGKGDVGEEECKQYLNEKLAEYRLLAECYEPRINPLNNKTVGAGPKEKGILQLKEMHEDYSIFEVISEVTPMAAGDVATTFRLGHDRNSAGSGPEISGMADLWSVLMPNKPQEPSKHGSGP